MPDEPRLPGQRAREGHSLLQRYTRVHNDAEKAQVVEMLNQVWPAIRFRHTAEGLLAYHLEGRPLTLPLSIQHTASVILRIDRYGQGTVVKHRTEALPAIVPARDLLTELTGEGPAGTKSRWEMIEEDWISDL